jgi:3-oxoacyl-(acyl-carrier-protein) synthase
MSQRVVVTGMGVVAPNAIGCSDFDLALRSGRSGVQHDARLQTMGFACQVSAVPTIPHTLLQEEFDSLTRRFLTSSGLVYGLLAAREAWRMADLPFPTPDQAPWIDAGAQFGTGLSGVEPLREAIYKVDEGKVRKLGSRVVEQTMASGISAWLCGMFGLGNQCSTNSSACATGTESIILAAERIRQGKAKLMLAGSCDSEGPYVWGGFDSMRVLVRNANQHPEQASAPLSAHAAGFVPGAGAGALILESLEHAQSRGATILGEYLGGAINSGGQLQGGTMTASNPEAVVRAMQLALKDAQISGSEVDCINGHLTATMGDAKEVKNWQKALGIPEGSFPFINSTKSMIGHCLGAAGSIEAVACLLQLQGGYVHPSINATPLHPDIAQLLPESAVPQTALKVPNLKVIAKSGFGFGDVNAVLLLKKWEHKP